MKTGKASTTDAKAGQIDAPARGTKSPARRYNANHTDKTHKQASNTNTSPRLTGRGKANTGAARRLKVWLKNSTMIWKLEN
jgi:hypothetical protein